MALRLHCRMLNTDTHRRQLAQPPFTHTRVETIVVIIAKRVALSEIAERELYRWFARHVWLCSTTFRHSIRFHLLRAGHWFGVAVKSTPSLGIPRLATERQGRAPDRLRSRGPPAGLLLALSPTCARPPGLRWRGHGRRDHRQPSRSGEAARPAPILCRDAAGARSAYGSRATSSALLPRRSGRVPPSCLKMLSTDCRDGLHPSSRS